MMLRVTYLLLTCSACSQITNGDNVHSVNNTEEMQLIDLELCPKDRISHLRGLIKDVRVGAKVGDYVNAISQHGNFDVSSERYKKYDSVCGILINYINTDQVVMIRSLEDGDYPRTQRIYIVADSSGIVIGIEERNFYYPT